ncbi:hypothetical protein KR018_007539 [Drosophila ironensis]|nr:hypothetical protein KR018_007539 [Drosophila ironensis]
MCQWLQIGFLVFMLHITTVFGQNLPFIACPGIFEYWAYRGQYIGHLSLYLDSAVDENVVNVELSQPGRIPPPSPGEITIMESEDEVILALRNQEKINYRIDFPTPGVIPKLIKVSLNGEVVCRASPYGAPSTKLSLTRYLKSTIPLVPLQPKQPQIPFRRPEPQPQPQWPEPPQRPNITEYQPAPQQPRRPQVEVQFIDYPEPPRRTTPPPTRAPVTPATRPTPRPQAPSSAARIPQTIGQINGVCGREKAIQTPFIHGGEAVERGQLPWMVTLLEHVGKEYNFLCGGTLISARTVISAAHCFRYGSRNLPGSRTTVSLGRNTLDFLSPGELRRVSLLVLHDQYDPSVYTDADLALLQLSEHVIFDDFIRPICLWNENFLVDLPSGYKSYVAGWGEDELGNRNSRQLKMTDTDIITQQECRGNLSADNVRFVTSRTICASNSKASGPCNGDSGGGLMLQEQDVWMLRGVVSAGQRLSNRCDLTQPVIYTDLAKHIEWLLRTMWF